MTDTLDIGWRGDPADILAACDPDAGAHLLATLIARSRPPWMAAAACARAENHGVTWFPGVGQYAAAAVTICNGCDVLDDCRAWALATPDPTGGHGIAGGLTPPGGSEISVALNSPQDVTSRLSLRQPRGGSPPRNDKGAPHDNAR